MKATLNTLEVGKSTFTMGNLTALNSSTGVGFTIEPANPMVRTEVEDGGVVGAFRLAGENAIRIPMVPQATGPLKVTVTYPVETREVVLPVVMGSFSLP